MPHRPARVPTHAGPIDSECDALEVLSFAVARPLISQTLAILLDDDRCAVAIVSVSGTVDPDAMFDVLDFCILSPDFDGFAATILVSVRPGGSVDRVDVDRWLEASDQCELVGLELVEWFVVGNDLVCPRDLLGEPPRWGST